MRQPMMNMSSEEFCHVVDYPIGAIITLAHDRRVEYRNEGDSGVLFIDGECVACLRHSDVKHGINRLNELGLGAVEDWCKLTSCV